MFLVIYPNADQHQAEEFWDRLLGYQDPTGASLRGFIEGALEAWEQFTQR